MTYELRDVFHTTMMNNNADSRKAAEDAFVEKMKSDPKYIELLARDYFERMAANWTVNIAAPGSKVFARTAVSQDKIDRAVLTRAEQAIAKVAEALPEEAPPSPVAIAVVRRTKEEAAARTKAAFEEMKAKVRGIVLLDLILPDGKALRDATGAECAKAGGFFADVAKAIKPSQVVDRHLSEGDLQNIKARFYQKNAA